MEPQQTKARLRATLVLRIDGLTSIGDGAKIVVANGLNARQVVIATLGGISSWGNSTTINGTILNGLAKEPLLKRVFDPQDCTIGSGATVNGALIYMDDISIGANARITSLPASAVIVPPICGDESAPVVTPQG
jgi:hypothetical protein